MSFAGHTFDMINRVKQNRALLKARRERILELRDKLYGVDTYIPKSGSDKEYRKLTEKERQELKHEIIKLERREKWGKLISFIIALLLTIGIFYLIINIFE